MGKRIIALHLLKEFLDKLHVDLILIQEPQVDLRKGKRIFPEFNIFTNNNNTVILVRSNLIVSHSFLDYKDNVGIIIKLNENEKVGIISTYIHPVSGLGYDELEPLINNILSYTNSWILAGDTNAHSPLWGPANTIRDFLAYKLEDLFEKFNLSIAPPPLHPTFIGPTGGRTFIDTLVFSQNFLPYKLKFDINCSFDWGQDHRGLLSYFIPKKPMIKLNKTFNFKNADYESISNFISPNTFVWVSKFNNCKDGDELDNLITDLSDYYKNAIELFTPKIKISSYSKDWWSKELSDLRKEYLKCFKIYRLCRRKVDYDNLVLSKKKYKKMIRKNKHLSWLKFCKENDTLSIWNKLKKFTKNYNINIPNLVYDNKLITSDKQKAEVLTLNMFPKKLKASSFQLLEVFYDIKLNNLKGKNTNLEFCDLNDIEYIIKSLKSSKASGLDGLPALFFKNCSKEVKHVVKAIINSSIRLHHFPSPFKIAKVVCLPKINPPPDNPVLYRPISLLSILGKQIESFMTKKIVYFLESNNLLSDFQMGFRRQRSSVKALWNFYIDVERNLNNKIPTLAISLDISKAYDNIWIKGLLIKMCNMKFPYYIICFIKSFLLNRKTSCSVNKNDCFINSLDFGLPQGSPLSPILFLIYINDLIDLISPIVKIQAFADDLIIWIGNKDNKKRTFKMQYALNLINRYSELWRIKFNNDKCCSILFWRRRNINYTDLFLNCIKLNRVHEMKYLGVKFTSSLTWLNHIQGKINDCNILLNKIRFICHRTMGFHPIYLDRIIRACILPKMFYASCIWASSAWNSSYCKIIDSMLRKAIINKDGLWWNTSLNECFILGNLLPSEFLIKKSLMEWIGSNKDHLNNYINSELRLIFKYNTNAEFLYENLNDNQFNKEWKNLINKYYRYKWHCSWKNSKIGKSLFRLTNDVEEAINNIWKIKYNRKDLSRSLQWASSNAHFPLIRHKFYNESSKCWFCHCIGSRSHILWYCDYLRDLRIKIIKKFNAKSFVELLNGPKGIEALTEYSRKISKQRINEFC